MDITGFDDTAMQTVQWRTVPDAPTVFTVPLDAYAFQPWFNHHPQLSQWFNYGLTPATWTTYAKVQAVRGKQQQNK
jgi:hypothetical protein